MRVSYGYHAGILRVSAECYTALCRYQPEVGTVISRGLVVTVLSQAAALESGEDGNRDERLSIKRVMGGVRLVLKGYRVDVYRKVRKVVPFHKQPRRRRRETGDLIEVLVTLSPWYYTDIMVVLPVYLVMVTFYKH